jgi:hypothetical protein
VYKDNVFRESSKPRSLILGKKKIHKIKSITEFMKEGHHSSHFRQGFSNISAGAAPNEI